MSDNVEHPSHYNAGDVETIDGIKSALGDAFLDYCRGNVLKYVWRCKRKGNLLEDLRKAAKYLEWAIEEAESEKPNEPEPLAIPHGWRELEPDEMPLATDMHEWMGGWIVRTTDSGQPYKWHDHRNIRKIETPKPEPLAIPEGWRELEFGETRLKTDLYSYDGKWNPYTDFDPAESEFPKYDKRIHQQHIRKIETAKPEHVEGVWVEEADANAGKIEPAETSDASIPDPGHGYRLLSKDPPERVQEGDEFWCDTHWVAWWPSSADCGSAVQSKHDYYRRKIEPAQWIPKVGDRVRVARGFMNPVGEIGFVKEFCAAIKGNFTISTNGGTCTLGWFKKDDVELIEAAQ